MKFSTKVIIAVYVTLILFTITMIALFLIKGSVPDSLITCVFAACSVECGALGLIKHGKVKYGDGNNEDINISDEDGEDNE
jgi:hypothetical protein